MTSAGQWMSSVKKEEGGMAGNNQYDNPPSWMGGRGSNQYDTGQNRNCDPGAAFLGDVFTSLLWMHEQRLFKNTQ